MTAFPSPDLALITMLDADYFRREPFATPYVSTFSAHGKSLCFVACEHTVGLESTTHRTLKTAFAEQSPRCVVLEGIPSGDPELAARLAIRASEQVASGPASCSEGSYASHLARDRSARAIGGEPPDEVLIDGAVKRGYQPRDVLCFYVFRWIPRWRREHGELTPVALAELAARYLEYEASRHLWPEPALGFHGFRTWFDAHRPADLRLSAVAANDTAPFTDSSATYFQRLSCALSRPREEHLVMEIAAALREHDRVLVAYGGGHIAKQRRVWEKVFGKSEDRKYW